MTHFRVSEILLSTPSIINSISIHRFFNNTMQNIGNKYIILFVISVVVAVLFLFSNDIFRDCLLWKFVKILPHLFFHRPKLEKLVPPFVPRISENFLRTNLSNVVIIYWNHCKNTLYFLSCAINRGCNVWCRRQMFKEIYTNLSLKVPNLVLFSPQIQLKSWVPPPLFLKVFPPL